MRGLGRKLVVVTLLALSLAGTGCVTAGMQDSIDRTTHDESQRAVLKVATFPVTAACDVALTPVYIVAAPVAIVALSGANWGRMH